MPWQSILLLNLRLVPINTTCGLNIIQNQKLNKPKNHIYLYASIQCKAAVIVSVTAISIAHQYQAPGTDFLIPPSISSCKWLEVPSN